MARYYLERTRDGRIDDVIAQDETGVWGGILYTEEGAPEVRITLFAERGPKPAFLPGWKDARMVLTTTRDYLEFVRTMERCSYLEQSPTEIMERPGSAQEVIRAICAEALAKGNAVIHRPMEPMDEDEETDEKETEG